MIGAGCGVRVRDAGFGGHASHVVVQKAKNAAAWIFGGGGGRQQATIVASGEILYDPAS